MSGSVWPILLLPIFQLLSIHCGEFKIDYVNNRFVKDGLPFQYASGSIHYFRIPPEYWQDRLLKLRAASLNTVQTYIAWNFHESSPGRYNFQNGADFIKFIKLAQNLSLNVIIRPGPYIDSEWDMGGLPWWLLKNGTDQIALRTSHPTFIYAMETWFHVVLPKVKPLLYENGGPILAVQVENEYGSYYACDGVYMGKVRDLLRKHLGDRVVLFTTDGPSEHNFKCGTVQGVYPTVDFGIGTELDVKMAFSIQRAFSPSGGPFVNSEFYPGWFDGWGGPHAHKNTSKMLDTIGYMWNMNASFNMYMFHGGTNFEYWAGAEDKPYLSVTTSYDYDAPLSESGDIGPKWTQLRQTMIQLTNNTNPDPIPPPIPKFQYSRVNLEQIGTILDLLSILAPQEKVVRSLYPISMEKVDHPFGYILYEIILKKLYPVLLFENMNGIRDRAQVILDGKLIQIIDRDSPMNRLNISGLVKSNSTLQILIENRGRVCFREINDTKGLLTNLTTSDGTILQNWTIYPIDLKMIFDYNSIKKHKKMARNINDTGFLPTIYQGLMKTKKPAGDTFLDPTGWGKGQAFINKKNIGRYWPCKGPQVTLYVPQPFLKYPKSTVTIFELEKPGNCDQDGLCYIKFSNKPILE